MLFCFHYILPCYVIADSSNSPVISLKPPLLTDPRGMFFCVSLFPVSFFLLLFPFYSFFYSFFYSITFRDFCLYFRFPSVSTSLPLQLHVCFTREMYISKSQRFIIFHFYSVCVFLKTHPFPFLSESVFSATRWWSPSSSSSRKERGKRWFLIFLYSHPSSFVSKEHQRTPMLFFFCLLLSVASSVRVARETNLSELENSCLCQRCKKRRVIKNFTAREVMRKWEWRDKMGIGNRD